MHADAYAFVALAAKEYQAAGPVYEIGSRNINGTVRGLFPRDGYLGVDIASGPDVDLVVNAASYLPPMPMGTAVCCEVLEHTLYAETIVTQAARALLVGGLLIITCAGEGRLPHSAHDGGSLRPNEHYQNLTRETVSAWAEAAGVESLPNPYRAVWGDVYYVGPKVRA